MIFTADIHDKSNEFKVTLQGNVLFAYELWKHVKLFKTKLAPSARQAVEDDFFISLD